MTTTVSRHKNKTARGIATLAALLLVAGAALAGPYEDARDAYNRGDYGQAITLLDQARQEQPNNPLIYAALGNSYQKQNNNADALRAYEELLRLDPDLSTIKNKRGFLQAYQAVGGDASRFARAGNNGGASAATGGASDVINALSNGDLFIGPEVAGQADANAISQAIRDARPTIVKVVVLDAKQYPWTKRYPTRAAFADDLRKRLNLAQDSVVVIGTPKGVAGSSGRLSNDQLNNALQRAGVDAAFARGGLTEAVVTAVRAVSGTAVSDRRADTGRGAGVIFIILAGIGGVVGFQAHKRKKAMEEARGQVEPVRQKVLENLSYVDGYLDLLPAGDDATHARALRQSAYEKFATVTGILKTAKTPEEIRQGGPLLQTALAELEECRQSIDKATGGTGVAMRVPELPNLQTDEQRGRDYLNLPPAEQIGAGDRARMQRLIEEIPQNERGVSFFSGRPMPASELVPVEIVVGGQKRTVMATRDEADAIARGETPQVRAFEQDGRYVPWYEYRGYDPYRDYYAADMLGTFVTIYALSSLMGPAMWAGYSPWGWGGYGWGMPLPPVGVGWGGPGFFYGGGYGYDGGYGHGGHYDPTPDYNSGGGFGGYDAAPAEPEHAAGFDFFGGGGNSGGGGFDFGGSSDSNDSGFDFGSSDSGGFDFGGGDFGGGDSGGGGGDW